MCRVCALDIDGVLNEYPDCWIKFINIKLGTAFEDLNEVKNTLSYARYKKLKHEYRESGYKLYIPIRQGAAEFTHLLKGMGYEIIIITSRPFDKYPNLRMLTKKWLDINDIEYDALISTSKKHIEIISAYPELEFMVEDNRSFANDIGNMGYPVFLMKNRYNDGPINAYVVPVNNLYDIYESIRRK